METTVTFPSYNRVSDVDFLMSSVANLYCASVLPTSSTCSPLQCRFLYSSTLFQIGEGTFAEVFCAPWNGNLAAFKIMPIGGRRLVNEEPQKTEEEIIPEVLASVELSGLSEVRTLDWG